MTEINYLHHKIRNQTKHINYLFMTKKSFTSIHSKQDDMFTKVEYTSIFKKKREFIFFN